MIIVKNIKKIVKPIAGILTSCVLAVTLPYTAFATGDANVVIGQKLEFGDVQPMIYQERTMIPLRDISKALYVNSVLVQRIKIAFRLLNMILCYRFR